MNLRPTRTAVVAGLASLCLAAPLAASVSPAAADDADAPADQPYRPRLHYTPEQNWMNDPNGLIYHEGTYHLYYQHNPEGTRWGNMSWGHATSTDLLHWEEQPLAIPQTFNGDGESVEDIFSGSVVSDTTNSSGFGTAEDPPLVAMYTSAYTSAHPTLAGRQAQSLAYSLDDGQTWQKYDGNPVLDRASANFRDPKVFRYDGPAGSYWVMLAVEATEHKVVLYRSDDLREWTHLSDFGPANATGGIWEVPDLFPLPVDGDADNEKWVMVVNLNPGAVAGGSGAQYFVGDFDGTTFTSETTVTGEPDPAGTAFAEFEGEDWADWTVANEPGNAQDGPFGAGPAAGELAGQTAVTGFRGDGLVNSFHDGDWPVGTLSSPTFTIDRPFLNFLVGGGRHPHVDGTQLANDPPAGSLLFDGFEYAAGATIADDGWTLTGDFVAARNPSTAGGDFYIGDKRINTFEGGPDGDDNTGSLTSPEFVVDGDHLSFLVGGGRRTDGTLEAQLLVDGEVVRTATGRDAGALNWRSWDVAEYRGQSVQLRLLDDATGGWGHLTFDHVVMGDEPARERSEETSVNLIVDGEVVRTATGGNSERLDWHSWDVADLVGQEASIEIVDNNRSGWGHVLADDFRFADQPSRSRLASYDWLDWGRDYYAAISFNGIEDGRRLTMAWMNNWDYGNDIPTSTWRSAMALPREVRLVSTPDGPRLEQEVVTEIDALRRSEDAWTSGPRTIADGASELPVTGDVVQVDAVLDPGTAAAAGISVLGGDSTSTRIGYDAQRGELIVDRTDSGDVSFNATFPSVERAPVTLEDGKLALRVYVDRASVEVFSGDGLTTVTDQVFPEDGADAIGVWAEGGEATLDEITVTPLDPAMWPDAEEPTDPPGPKAFTKTPSPRLVGAVRVGARVRVDLRADRWRPRPASYRIRWVVGGKRVRGADGRALTIRRAMKGKKVWVRVTARRAGYEPVVVRSAKRRVR